MTNTDARLGGLAIAVAALGGCFGALNVALLSALLLALVILPHQIIWTKYAAHGQLPQLARTYAAGVLSGLGTAGAAWCVGYALRVALLAVS